MQYCEIRRESRVQACDSREPSIISKDPIFGLHMRASIENEGHVVAAAQTVV